MSIVGIDRIPLPYYKAKLRVEEALTASGLGHTIIRATQFHDLIETIFSIQRFSPALIAIKGVRFQPIDTRDVAAHLVSLIDEGAAGRVDDIGGPAVTTTTSWPACTSLPAAAVDACVAASARWHRRSPESGANLVPANPVGTIGFAEYLARTT